MIRGIDALGIESIGESAKIRLVSKSEL